ncbi:uncharacterized protein UV8b_00404 [Ustilaginoidea virens]|uniref:Zn(2)-C6 fungal-type domain-containing protein n=1 Tax=Ustilaginoidea virens TaxID=1159556 RepID=A0A8E5HIX9_USTVR|nr:uncharacterized protein UV8b_00404 [Ustilaginoidea virens]QUC16163.1 hypothetical protein UV8b_00404 [Ustilaginoidea virens]
MAGRNAAEDESNSVLSNDDGESSGGGDTTQRDGPAAAGHKRKRQKHQKTSCELCKARKVKCDRAEPACSWCARHDRPCVYLARQKPGSRIGFALELETKINRVDALLQTLWRRVEDHIANDHGPQSHTLATAVSSGNGSNPAQLDGYGHGTPGTIRHDLSRGASVTQPAALARPPWLSGDAPETLQQQSSSVDFATRNASLPNHDESFTPASRLRPGRNGSTGLGLSAGSDLPPQDMIYTLVDLYFKHCNTWCPILDRKTTFGIFFGSTSMSEVDRILLHAIMATTLRFLKDSRLSPEMRAHYHAVSRHAVMIYAMEHVSIEAQRALVILALDELGTSTGPRGWNMLSILAQNVRQLHLGEESSLHLSADESELPSAGPVRKVAIPQPDSWIEDEGRRRLCWMVYLLDRYATIATTTFDFMLDDGKMNRVLPCSYDLFSRNVPVETSVLDQTTGQQGATGYAVNKPENLGSFSYHCQILRTMSKVHDFLKAPVDVTCSAGMARWRGTYRSLDAALNSWLQSLPSEYSRISALCHSDPASRVANWFMLHSAYVTAVVRLHSSAAYPSVRSPISAPSHYAMQRCLSAVQSLRDITQDVFEANGLDLVGPPFAFSLWTAARLLIVHAATMGGPVDAKIDFFIEILGHVGKYWQVAISYARILARVVQRARRGEMGLGAMRRNAHELVQMASATRRSGLDDTASQSVRLRELDSVDVFDFFHYPTISIPAPKPTTQNGRQVPHHPQGLVTLGSDEWSDGAVPDPASDWLGC